jgi:hypothetical protein
MSSRPLVQNVILFNLLEQDLEPHPRSESEHVNNLAYMCYLRLNPTQDFNVIFSPINISLLRSLKLDICMYTNILIRLQ